jgi:peptidoglycan/LPS O-acetylase OafA/YrhL
LSQHSVAAGTDRLAALDGLRGLTIVMVVLNHAGGYLWPRESIDGVPLLRGLFGSGTVSVFFVVGGFIVTRNLLRERERGVLDPARFYARRVVRLGVQLVPLAAAVVLVHHVDSQDPYSDDATYGSVVSALTFTTNNYARHDLLSLRSDLGHLWYLSVQQQAYLVLPLLLLLLASRRALLAGLLAGLMAAVVVWRYHVLGTSGWVVASSLTTTRSDGLVLGVLLAVAFPWLRRAGRHAPLLVCVSGGAMVGMVLLLGELSPLAFLRSWGVWFELLAGVLVVGVCLLERPTGVSRLLASRPLARLGKASLATYVWHLPVIVLLWRHTPGWHWAPRTAVAVLLLGAVVVVAERYVEEPTRRFLATSPLLRSPVREPVR